MSLTRLQVNKIFYICIYKKENKLSNFVFLFFEEIKFLCLFFILFKFIFAGHFIFRRGNFLIFLS